MLTFDFPGTCGLSGLWSSLTTAKGFNKFVLDFPGSSSHFVPYTTGGTAALHKGETLTGTSGATVYLLESVVENGTAGTGDSGFVFINRLIGTPTSTGETWTGSVSGGTIVTAQAPISTTGIRGPARACLITVEVAAIQFTQDGTIPTVNSGTNYGHNLNPGDSYGFREWETLRKFQVINTAAGAGSVVKYSMYY